MPKNSNLDIEIPKRPLFNVASEKLRDLPASFEYKLAITQRDLSRCGAACMEEGLLGELNQDDIDAAAKELLDLAALRVLVQRVPLTTRGLLDFICASTCEESIYEGAKDRFGLVDGPNSDLEAAS